MKIFSKLLKVNEDQLKKYSRSTLWMIIEKVIRLSFNLIIGIWIARHLGPSDYGIFNFAIAVSTLLLPIINFGLQGVLVKELYQKPQNKESILGTAIYFKALLAVTVFVLILISLKKDLANNIEEEVVLLTCISILFHPFLSIETWYESQVKVKKIVIYKSIFFILASIIKVVLILNEGTISAFAIVYSIEAFLIALALVLVYCYDYGLSFNFRKTTLRNLISKSWLLVLSSLSAVIYLKIDQLMIGILVSDEELGYYSAATKISESWYFVPLIVSNALFPAILEAKSKSQSYYLKRLQQLCDYYFLASLSLAILISLSSNWLIDITYGEVFSSAAIILKLHIWAGIFIFLRTVLSKWLIAEEKYKFSLISQLSGAVVNVMLNLILIPMYGGIGAAWATIVSYLVASILILGFFKETKGMFSIFIKSFLSPIRLLLKQ